MYYYCFQTSLQLADPTQLQLAGLEDDFVFPQEGEEEGRKKEERNFVGPIIIFGPKIILP